MSLTGDGASISIGANQPVTCSPARPNLAQILGSLAQSGQQKFEPSPASGRAREAAAACRRTKNRKLCSLSLALAREWGTKSGKHTPSASSPWLPSTPSQNSCKLKISEPWRHVFLHHPPLTHYKYNQRAPPPAQGLRHPVPLLLRDRSPPSSRPPSTDSQPPSASQRHSSQFPDGRPQSRLR